MGSFIGVQKIAAKKIGISFEEYIEKIKKSKWCTSCKSWQPFNVFDIDNYRGDKLSAKCHNCTRAKTPYASLKGRISTFKGKHHTEETKKLLSNQRKGNKSPMEGKTHSVEVRIKISQILRVRSAKGNKCHSYKDGKMVERKGQRRSNDYKRWRFDVFARDKFTCQKCFDNKGGNLNAHHIKPFADYEELRFDISNGITLCESCHKKEHKAK